MRKKAETAADFLAELEKDPEYIAMRAEKERKQQEFDKLLTEDEHDLIAELAAVGVRVSSVWDLVNTSEPYPTAIPVLLRHLVANHHSRTREGIARALIVPESRGVATAELVSLFKRFDDPEANDFKWVLAQAIAAAATKESLDEIIVMARDKRNGNAQRGRS